MDAHSITLDGYRHRYYASIAPNTSYPPVVALHGFGTDGRRTFRRAGGLLRERGITLYALDLLGFGESEMPDRIYSLQLYSALNAAFVMALDLPSPMLLGHSMGGKIAAASALLHPDAFSAVLLVNPGGFSWMAPWLPVVAGANWAHALLRRRWARKHLLPRLPLGHVLARPESFDQALRLRHSHYALDLDATGLRPQLRTMEAPVGVIWGLRDALLPPRTLDRLRATLPQALIYRLPRSGHLPMWNQPREFCAAVHRFIARIN